MKEYQKLMSAMANAFPILIVGSFLLAIGHLELLGGYDAQIIELGSNILLVFLPIYGGHLVAKDSNNRNFVYGAMIGVLSNMYHTGMLGTIIGCIVTVKIYQFLIKLTFMKRLGPQTITILYPMLLGVMNALLFVILIAPPTTWITQMIMQSITVDVVIVQILIGAIFGLLMILDLGGPINKANSLVLNALYLEGYTLGATIKMTGGMVAPVGIGLAKVIQGDKRGFKNIVQGASFITETLIIHSLEDKENIKIASTVGTGLTCALVGYYQIQSYAIQGGLIMAVTFSNPVTYLWIFLSGTIITCVLYLILAKIDKKNGGKR